jgi:hypothetical protein
MTGTLLSALIEITVFVATPNSLWSSVRSTFKNAVDKPAVLRAEWLRLFPPLIKMRGAFKLLFIQDVSGGC